MLLVGPRQTPRGQKRRGGQHGQLGGCLLKHDEDWLKQHEGGLLDVVCRSALAGGGADSFHNLLTEEEASGFNCCWQQWWL